MKRMLLLVLFVFGVSYSGFAAGCASESLADYLLLSPAGCTVGDITFSDFAYKSLTIDASTILVSPDLMGAESGLEFNHFWGAAPGFSVDSFISFTATCNNGCLIDDLVLTAAGASATTPGSIANASETTTPLVMGVPLAVGSAGGTTILTDSATFAPISSLRVGKDIGASGGIPGTGGIVLRSATSPTCSPQIRMFQNHPWFSYARRCLSCCLSHGERSGGTNESCISWLAVGSRIWAPFSP